MGGGQLVLLTTSNFQHTRLTPLAPSLREQWAHVSTTGLHTSASQCISKACLKYSVPYSYNIEPKQSILSKLSMAHSRAQCPLLQECTEACPRTLPCQCRKGGEAGTGESERDESSLTAKGKQILHVGGIH